MPPFSGPRDDGGRSGAAWCDRLCGRTATRGAPRRRNGREYDFGFGETDRRRAAYVGYAEVGPPVILLHGWPYDIHSYAEVAPLLAANGYRVIVPYLRGFGTTHFLSTDTIRNGQPSAMARDVVDLLDALEIERAIIGGFDWGARAVAALDNPSHVDIVIHNYRWRLGLAKGEAKYDDLKSRLARSPVITAPTITLEGDANGAPHADPGTCARKFSGRYAHRIIAGGVGRNLPQEAPHAFVKAIIDVDDYY